MIYRAFNDIHLSSLTYGTSTFVSGKLFPNKKSEEGVESLKLALSKGINSIHSNPKLKTQWAIQKIPETTSKNHFIKIETPLNKSFDTKEYFNDKIDESLINLNIQHITGIIHEVDLKNTINKSDLSDRNVLSEHFKHIYSIFDTRFSNGKRTYLIEMVNNQAHMEAALSFGLFDGFAGYFNLLNNWCSIFFEDINKLNKNFIGLRPLAYTNVFDTCCHSKLSKILNDHSSYIKKNNFSLSDIALLFSLFHPVISTAITGMSQLSHVIANIDSIGKNVELNWLRDINEALLK